MISIVIPCYNEDIIIEDFINELKSNLDKLDENFEIIFVDNNSIDQTVKKIQQRLSHLNFTNYKLIRLSNYFGKESAILAGLDNASGDATIIMDPDLEDPPNLISKFLLEWKKGFKIVYGKRKSVKTSLFNKIMRKVFYFIFKNLVDKNFLIPENSGDFRLLDKEIYTKVISMRERTRFLRGLVSYVGHNQKGIEFDRPFRKKGKSKSNFSFLVNYGLDALLSSTSGPAGLISKFGIIFLSLILFVAFFIIINKFFFSPYEGFSFTIILILFLFSLNTLMLGVIGEYVTRIYNEVKNRPNYIIKEIIKN